MIQEGQARMNAGGAGALVDRRFAPLEPPRHDDATLDLVGLISILRRRLSLIIATAAVVVSLAAVYAFMVTPLYTATTKILVDARKKNTVQTEVVPSGLGNDVADNFALVDSQVKVILSDTVLGPVVKSQHLATDPEFGARPPSLLGEISSAITGIFSSPKAGRAESPDEKALLALGRQVEVKRDDQTYVIDVSVKSMDPVKAARLAQAIAKSYLADQSKSKVETSERVSQLMDGQLATLRERLLKADTKVQAFRAEHNLQGSGADLIDTRKLKGLNDQLTSAQADVADKEAKYNQIQLLLKHGIEPEMMGDAIASETVSRLREQYAIASRREAILSATLLPSHPQLQQAHSEVERLRGLIKAEVERVAEAANLDFEMAKQRLASAKAAVEASRQEVDVNDSARIKLRELQREADSTRSVYESFLSRVKEMNETQRIYTPDARIISPAAIPKNPSWPKKKIILALALVLGCGLGASLAVSAEHLDRRIRTTRELLAATGLRSLASIPTLHARRGLVPELLGQRPRRASFYEMVLEILEGPPDSAFRASLLRLLSYLMDFDVAGKQRIVLLTSSVSGEGKSALALSLAVAAASSGMRTLLVDASTANPSLSKVLGDGDKSVALGERVITDTRLGLSFLSLASDEVPSKGWSKRGALTDELSQVAADYDITLIDAGLLRLERNAAALVDASQAILLATKASATTREAAAQAASDLMQMAHGRRCAAVLTMTESEANNG